MKHLNQNPREFIEALKQGLSIVCEIDGSWFVEGQFMQIARRCFAMEETRLLSLAHALDKELDRLETIPVRFGSKPVEQQADFQSILEASQLVLKMLHKHNSTQTVEWSHKLARKVLALQYRLERVNGGLDPAPVKEDLLFPLKRAAIAWKKEEAVIVEKTLSRPEIEVLSETASYTNFAELVINDPSTRSQYFEWIFKDKNTAAPFIVYPHLQSKIVECALNGRIGRMGGTQLQITKVPAADGVAEKCLTMLMENTPVSLLDETAPVTFKGNYTLTIKEIFEVFKNKMYKVGNLEVLKEGIINWNVHHLGYWDADKQIHHKIDLTQPRWWEQLPLFETLRIKEVIHRYGIVADGSRWIVAARATRGTPTLDYDKTHAFMELAIPGDDGTYAVYDFGKFAYQFPSSFFNSLLTFCLNMHATIAYPDENVFYTHRQHGCYPFAITNTQGLQLMELIKEDLIKAREYNLVFQIESDNCAKWLYEKLTAILTDTVPNLFKMSLMKTEPFGFVGACFNILRKLNVPEQIQFKLLTLIHIPFGASTGTRILENGKLVIKALVNHEFWRTSEVYLPAFLIAQIQSGALKKVHNTSTEKETPSSRSWIWLVDKVKDVMAFEFDQLLCNLNRKRLSRAPILIPQSTITPLWKFDKGFG